MGKFNRYEGALSDREFNDMASRTYMHPTTKDDLRRFLVDGLPLSTFNRARRQFLRNKLTDLEYRGLIR